MMSSKRILQRIKDIIFCWDFLVSFAISIGLYFAIASDISNSFCQDIYGIGISVLSIVFSIYFAALAIIISSSDDDFVNYLEDQGAYTGIIWTFRYSLFVLFVALLFSLLMYALTSAWINSSNVLTQNDVQPREYFSAFVFLFFYGLFCALNTRAISF
jgi:hypothetical protein